MAFGSVLNLSTLNGSNGFAINGVNAYDFSGISVSSAGDVNGDGKSDLIIGAHLASSNGNRRSGQSYVVFGSSNGFASSLNLSTLNGSNGFAINGVNAYDFSGISVSVAGDVNGDGKSDLIIGAYNADPNSKSNSGQSYVVFGSSNGFASSLNLSTLNGSNGFALNGVNADDRAGISVSVAGDVNGDGKSDLIIGARNADPNGRSYSGQSYVVFGSSNGFASSLNLSTLNGSNGFALNGVSAYDLSGSSVSGAGDINGDGIDDLIIGAEGADPNGLYSGQSYVVFGSSSGFASSLNLSTLNGSNGFALNGVNASDNSGRAVSSAGDVNGDGNDDLIIGARYADPNGKGNSGQSYVVFGSTNGFASSLNLSTLNGSNGFALNGVNASDNSGRAVSSAGDVNGDGNDDLIIGAPYADPNGLSSSGQSYVVFGSSNGFASSLNISTLNGSNGFAINGVNADDFSGSSVSVAGDVNGDGKSDLIIGAFGAEPNGKPNGNIFSGQSYVVFGQASTSIIEGDNNDNLINGTSADDTIIGYGGNDTLNGLDGNDSLDGGAYNDILDGGTGNDTLNGGQGNDTYIIDTLNDVIQETSTVTTEIDTVETFLTYTLFNNLENLTLTGSSNIDGFGNSLDNILTGNIGDNTLDGQAGNDTLDGSLGNDTLIGGLDNDTYIVNSSADVVSETSTLATEIDTVQSGATYTLFNNLENLTLTGSNNIDGEGNSLDNIITGNIGDNTLDGQAGNDTLDGSLGNDTLIGALNNDTYIVNSSADVVSETSTLATEIDTVQSGATYTLGNNLENLTLTGSSNLEGEGNSLDNNITGNSGDNTLDGNAGNDTLTGGQGNDFYIVDSSNDVVSETSTLATEIDTVQSGATYTLGNNLENLTLTGSSNLEGEGNSLDNNITGNSGDNTLDGNAGNDTLTGGQGNDFYIVDSSNDVVSETSTLATEIDTVQSGATYTLGNNLENLTLTGSNNIDGEGNSLDNIITGNIGDNTLDGQAGNDTLDGSLGNDTLIGALNNDTYIVNSSADVVSETSTLATEIDTVQSGATYTLGNNLENLTLTGSSNLEGEGNSLDNNITGNSGDNTLDGNAGNDTLTGGQGNDFYIVDSSNDVVSETSTLATEIDTVQSGATYTLGNNLENLTLTGSSNLEGEGNSLDNNITGNSGDNTLDGNAGNDTLTGGQGNDTYIVNSSNDVVSETSTLATEIDTVQSGAIYTLGNNLENLTLTGSSNLEGEGNSLDNNITGNSGDNTLDGNAGNDTLTGGQGNDFYIVDSADDVISETSTITTEIDTVLASENYLLSANLDNLTLTGNDNIEGIGNNRNNYLLGNSGDNILIGFTGNDTLDGQSGSDTLIGGSGNDLYVISNTNDVIQEIVTINTQIDTVQSSVTYTLFNNLENLTLTGSGNVEGVGNSLDNSITANSGNNIIRGGQGKDTLMGNVGNDYLGGGDQDDSLVGGVGNDTVYGGFENDFISGGSGNDLLSGDAGKDYIEGGEGNDYLDGGAWYDTMVGGEGNDTYIVDSFSDVLNETSTTTTEIDTVQSGATYTLSANLEVLTLTGSGNLEGVGNNLDNSITGNSGNNIIRGDQGKDTLMGNVGNDYLGGGNQDDSLVGGFGNDSVYGGFENDSISGGDGNDLLAGDAGKDSLDGGQGNDYLDGGAWYDTMVGGEGNDTYIVDSFSDVINETSTTTTEIDSVRNSADFSLSANLENLLLQGSANIFGTGNSLENIITGNIGNNFLTGGDGADTLTGNDGNDRLKGDKGSDTLTGGNGNDTLIGYGGANEIDTFTGGAGNDVFYLGDSSTIFYNGDNNSGYGLMTDFAVGDKIQLKSPSSNYELVTNINFIGTTANDTAILTTDGDIIGIVQDDTSVISSLTSNIFIYV